MNEWQNTLSQLGDVQSYLQQERARLSIVGRALTEQERECLASIECALPSIGEAIDKLCASKCEPLMSDLSPTPSSLADGRYEGGNHELYVELRVDEAVSGIISADLYRNGITGRSFVASIRTIPGVRIQLDAGAWDVVGVDVEGNRASGHLTLTPLLDDGASLTGTLRIDTALTSLPVRVDVPFAAVPVSQQMRRLAVEFEREEDVDPLPAYDLNGTEVTLRSVFENAGFDLGNVGELTIVPKPQYPWGTSQLHTLMVDLAQAQLSRPAWELHLLLLGKSSRNGLLGIMFDSTDPLPRQGAAVFATEIENRVSAAHFPRKLIQTTAHELGHALNLAHRFEREVGRADSTSIMNYDWRFRGGNHENEFWSAFNFTFDDDELEFLRHAPRPHLIPGGSPFHSVNYWSDGNGGYSPYVPEVPIRFFELTLRPPESGAVFDFGQPVFLEIELRNLTNEPFPFTPFILDVKAGLLEILIRRRGSDSTDRFNPIIERCFDSSIGRMAELGPGGTLSNNLNLTYGSAGFPFAEPGEYDVTALLVFYDKQRQQDLIVKSNTVRVRVRFPHSRGEEDDASILLQDDVGAYFALGGTRALSKAHDALQAIWDRRKDNASSPADPIVANIIRCAGIDAGRPYERFVKGKFCSEGGDRMKAADLLEQLSKPALKTAFDPHTAKHTAALAKKHRAASRS